tara:strand:+ start:2216 stop:2479 length:264 start_codon:yes stop_codon:yes gene_type:complete
VPKYAYRCKKCDHCFEAVHGMLIKLRNCDKCSMDGSLFRVPSVDYSTKNDTSPELEKKTGEIVKEFISDVKKEVEEQKREMKEGYSK